MCSTSQKHRDFVSEPMGDNLVTELPGIGSVLGSKLSEAKFTKAYNVLGQFLVLDKNEELFVGWLKETCSANSKQAGDCYTALNAWCDEHL
ncbi:barrier-to-autointegration factor-like [Haliotis asinina]|uniref:barrier-to-autointegration factor-like n=1 Tax=Haliotis asinina TaxID=109174 RepID=UPI0035321F46